MISLCMIVAPLLITYVVLARCAMGVVVFDLAVLKPRFDHRQRRPRKESGRSHV